ncbi:MAG: hypothetical protein U5R31_13885 [Acidimicrobiia bacterium]|nr:hypothetical protein [Acidimicrobiia bacterium]
MNDERAAEGVDHLQTAALELVEAARAFLDVVEELVSDREKVAEAVTVVGDVARAASRSSGVTTPDEDGDASGPATHVERITLSS